MAEDLEQSVLGDAVWEIADVDGVGHNLWKDSVV
jgi:hypothetical protein